VLKPDITKRLMMEFPHLHRGEIERAIDAIFGQMGLAMQQRSRIEIRGFGTFEIRERQARISRNPRTGTSVNVPAKGNIRFRPSRQLLKRIND
jgi:integration host factor subunit beta